MIYLDSAAMHPVLPVALEAFKNAPFGNPSSEHAVGQAARDALEQAREKIAALMDCEPEEIYFTATATEAAALAIHSLETSCVSVIASVFEHHSISENIRELYYTKLASAHMLAQNETGEVFTDPKSFRGCHYSVVDATAAVGHIPVSFKTLGCDYLIADGIKFGGVPGAAFLVAKTGAPLSPMIRGGGQERGMRSGTENVPAICAMAAALKWQCEQMEENTAKLRKMQFRLAQFLSEIDGVELNTPFGQPNLPHILNISFTGVDAHAIALLLSKDGVMVSPGAACSNGNNEPSHVIMAMFHDEARARSAIRISLSHENTMEECQIAAEKIKDAVWYIRGLT